MIEPPKKEKNPFPGFKAQFGNTDHLRIVEEMARFYHMRNEYFKVIKIAKKKELFKKKCIEQRNKVRKLIENAIYSAKMREKRENKNP